MGDEFCPECGAKITGNTGFCSECGAVTTSLQNHIEETTKLNEEADYLRKLKRWYHKKDKDNKLAILYSIALPFSGNFYLNANFINSFLTLISIMLIFGNIIGLLVISDLYSVVPSLATILIIWWVLSLIYLLFSMYMYNHFKNEFSEVSDKLEDDSEFSKIFNSQYIKYVPFIILIIFLMVNAVALFGDAPKVFATEDFSMEYPHEYQSDKNWIFNQYSGGYVEVFRHDELDGNNIKVEMYPNGIPIKEIDGIKEATKSTVDNVPAYILSHPNSGWTKVYFKNGNQLYQITFNGDAQQYTDQVLNSFKFK